MYTCSPTVQHFRTLAAKSRDPTSGRHIRHPARTHWPGIISNACQTLCTNNVCRVNVYHHHHKPPMHIITSCQCTSSQAANARHHKPPMQFKRIKKGFLDQPFPPQPFEAWAKERQELPKTLWCKNCPKSSPSAGQTLSLSMKRALRRLSRHAYQAPSSCSTISLAGSTLYAPTELSVDTTELCTIGMAMNRSA